MSTIQTKVTDAILRASTVFSDDRKGAFRRMLSGESDPNSRWVIETVLENAEIAEKSRHPTCDDTGIPHLILEVGGNRNITAEMLRDIQSGVKVGMRSLPCRPMAVKGDETQRLEQSQGLFDDPAALETAPLRIKVVDDDVLRLHILMQGGGPEIRGKTYRVFHKHSLSVVVDEIVSWATESAGQLGCTPCTPAIGIGRSHFEASSLMLEAMCFGNYNIQSPIEQEITERLNKADIGPLGLGGNSTALATFLRIGPQRASGVRIVSLRLCCCVEPRVAHVDL